MMNLQEVLKSVESLSTEDQTYLFDRLKVKLNKQQESTTGENGSQKQELIRSLRGKYENLNTSSEEFALRKQEEIDLEGQLLKNSHQHSRLKFRELLDSYDGKVFSDSTEILREDREINL